MRLRLLTYCLISTCLLWHDNALIAQGTIQEYGKNRVQFDDDFKYWNQYETQNFVLFYYGKSKDIVEASLLLAEENSEDIRNLLEYRFNEKIDIIVYADIQDFKQSNIGNEEIFQSNPGETKITENKMFVYHTGDYRDLKRQIREGIAKIYLEQMQVSTSVQEFVQNAVNTDLPPWFTNGIIAFVGEEWSPEVDNQLRQLLLTHDYDGFYDLAADYPRLAGHMFWYYTAKLHGKEAISNLLYLNRINRRLDNSFIYSIGMSMEQLTSTTFEYFYENYQKEVSEFDSLNPAHIIALRNKRKIPYSQIAIHPNRNEFVYVTNEVGQFKVFHYKDGKSKKLYKQGSRNPFQVTDYNNPLIRWNKEGQILGMIYTKREKSYFKYWNFRKETSEIIKLDPKIEKVYSFDFYDNGHIVMAASERGQIDIYKFNLRNRNLDQITEDYYDEHDLAVASIGNRKGILFSSNREQPQFVKKDKMGTVPLNTFDLFFIDLTEDAERIHQLTKTPNISETQPKYIDDNHIYYKGTYAGLDRLFVGQLFQKTDTVGRHVILKNGRNIYLSEGRKLKRINPRYVDTTVAWIDKVYSLSGKAISNHHSQVEQFDVNESHLLWSTSFRSQPQLYLAAKENFQNLQPTPTFTHQWKKLSNQKERKKKDKDNIVPTDQNKDQAPPKPTFKFQSKFDDPPNFRREIKKIEAKSPPNTNTDPVDQLLKELNTLSTEDKKEEKVRFIPSRSIAYRYQFKFEDIVTNLDNQPLFGGLNTFAGMPQGYNFPPMGFLAKFTASDLFEDYEITAGVRIPTSFNGSEYFVYFDDRKKRLDKRYALYRRSISEPLDNQRINFQNIIAIYELRYPLDIFRSFRLINTLRFDNEITLSTEPRSLTTSNNNEQRIGVRLEYVFDNTYFVKTNMLNGSRYKFWVEGMNRFQVDLNRGNYSLSDAFMTLMGLDARHYIRLGKHAILAGRLSGATSFGSEQILYFMGGVENWFFAENSELITIPPEGNFAFQTLAANMRGFRQNARNGASYLLSNIELRVAPFNYFSKKDLQSKFLRNFQLIGFVDVGTAWYGLSPYSDDNPLNTINVSNPPAGIDLTVNYFRDPIIVGVGGGIRANLFGYFLKLDYAWGYETKVWQKPLLFLSMGYDF